MQAVRGSAAMSTKHFHPILASRVRCSSIRGRQTRPVIGGCGAIAIRSRSIWIGACITQLSSLPPRSPVNVASMAPPVVTSKNVNNVGLKDAPLQSLFPAEPKPPAPVGHLGTVTCAWQQGALFSMGMRIRLSEHFCGLSSGCPGWAMRPPGSLLAPPTCRDLSLRSPRRSPTAHTLLPFPTRRVRRSSRWPSWEAVSLGCPRPWSCWTRGEGEPGSAGRQRQPDRG